ncbi:hypothetical protein P7C70_g6105, partial [Phenoliferia sp. Uapishka_3]
MDPSDDRYYPLAAPSGGQGSRYNGHSNSYPPPGYPPYPTARLSSHSQQPHLYPYLPEASQYPPAAPPLADNSFDYHHPQSSFLPDYQNTNNPPSTYIPLPNSSPAFGEPHQLVEREHYESPSASLQHQFGEYQRVEQQVQEYYPTQPAYRGETGRRLAGFMDPTPVRASNWGVQESLSDDALSWNHIPSDMTYGLPFLANASITRPPYSQPPPEPSLIVKPEVILPTSDLPQSRRSQVPSPYYSHSPLQMSPSTTRPSTSSSTSTSRALATGMTRLPTFSISTTTATSMNSSTSSSSTGTARSFRSDPTIALSLSAVSHRAKEHRAESSLDNTSNQGKTNRRSAVNASTARKKGTKLSIEQVCVCRLCGNQFANATLRGTDDDLAVEYRADFVCLNCSPKAAVPSSTSEGVGKDELGSEDFGNSYEDTLSAAVDRLEGLELTDPRPAPTSRSGLTGRKRRAVEQELVSFRTPSLSPLTCATQSLSHSAVWPISEISSTDANALLHLCRELWISTILSTLATPETLEVPGALARTFSEINNLARDSWTLCEPYLRDNIDESQDLRSRYIALRWSVPAPRKKSKVQNKEEETMKLPTDARVQEEINAPVIRTDGKQLAGFIIGELDLQAGSLFLPFTMPTGVGETFESTTIVLQRLHTRIKLDMEARNLIRQQQGLSKLVELTNAWTMRLYKKETRILIRRGYLTLDEYLLKYPDADPEGYPPTRPVFLPPQLLRGWETFVKPLAPDDDWGHSRPAGREARLKPINPIT